MVILNKQQVKYYFSFVEIVEEEYFINNQKGVIGRKSLKNFIFY